MNTIITQLSADHCTPATHPDNPLTSQHIRLTAEQGFTQLQESLGRQKINPGDALLAFTKCDGNDKDALTRNFCLAITMLSMVEPKLNTIGDDIFNKILDYVVKLYGEKIDN